MLISIQMNLRTQRQGEIGIAMATAPTGQHRYLQGFEYCLQQRPQRLYLQSGKVPYQHTAQPVKPASQTQLGQQPVDAVQRLVNILDKQNAIAAVEFC
ncbi:hypothetical protein D3C73_1326960 [compost metagenome]